MANLCMKHIPSFPNWYLQMTHLMTQDQITNWDENIRINELISPKQNSGIENSKPFNDFILPSSDVTTITTSGGRRQSTSNANAKKKTRRTPRRTY